MEHAHEGLKENLDVVKAAVSHNGYASLHVHAEVQENPDVVKVAASQKGMPQRTRTRTCRRTPRSSRLP